MTMDSSFPVRQSSDAVKHGIGIGSHRGPFKSESGHILTIISAKQLKSDVAHAKKRLSKAEKIPAKEVASLKKAELEVRIISTGAKLHSHFANAKYMSAKEALSPKHYELLQSIANRKTSKISTLYSKVNSLWSDFILPLLRSR